MEVKGFPTSSDIYLELEGKKQDLETKIARCLEAYEYETARSLCEELEIVIEKM